jgi:hypothetical protein
MSNHENYGHFEVRLPIGSVTTENGTDLKPSRFGRRPVKFQPLTEMNGVYKATRVSSSTTPTRAADSDTLSNEAQTAYGELGLSGEERHFMSMLESPDITTEQANTYINDYYS